MDKYKSAMVLSAAGDAIGYRNGNWKLNQSGSDIMNELNELGGIDSLSLEPSIWPSSDETLMHMATARALIAHKKSKQKEPLFQEMAKQYVKAFSEASLRRPDPAYKEGCSYLRPGQIFGWHIPYDKHGTGFGAATKAMCLGLVYSKPDERKDLIAVATECGRMTHNHPLGFTGSVCTALFTSLILQSKPITSWGREMLSAMEVMEAYCKKTIRNYDEYKQHWFYFETKWENYLNKRKILNDGEDTPHFPAEYGVEERDKVYRSWSSEGQAGRRGHDAPMIAYDALLAAHQSKNGNLWENVCHRAMIHGGESDATGSIAGFWYGLMYGFEGVPSSSYQAIEFKEELEMLATSLYQLANE
ncbi:inactive ADP-ribosyltransferase arh2-like [Clavelina lepadiformis]|uniref:inactive ADP-ribosyltransferase arh2-like n=1 Tax=Clavelina lepadiformis TaxID=159417 RepID=UPI004041883D